ncbi:MAG: flavodoxin domain-containing protein, partial [Myxococcota bacterium]
MKIVVVVASDTGRTRRMAEEFAAGAREAGAEVSLRPAADARPAHLEAADAIVLGSG